MAERSFAPGAVSLFLLAALTGVQRAMAQEAEEPFDWIVPPGITMYFDTVEETIYGGDGVISGQRTVLDGVVDVRGVIIPSTSRVVFLGPNPVTILASGDVSIQGKLDLCGAPATPTPLGGPPRPGAPGRAGGGDGGDASPRQASSSPRGGHGRGAFGRPRAGGGGGESSFHPLNKNARRGAGGGGGRFGPDTLYTLLDPGGVPRDVPCQTLLGMDAEPGFPGGQDGTGAASQTGPARGGRTGLVPFRDASSLNDFYGVARTLSGLVVGELDRPWAGSGGGAGGDAIRSSTFPNPAFPNSEEYGGAGGGGGGSLTILALGAIFVGESGAIHADGGRGAGGENTNFLDRVGGGGGGGSGGHIVLQSATCIRVLAIAENTGPDYDDPILPPPPPGEPDPEHPQRPISARGGQGGVGKDNVGGARDSGESAWPCDAIPLDRLTVYGLMVPPLGLACFDNLAEGGDPAGTVRGAGGDGGPGLIQLHVPDPETDLIFADDDLTKSFMPRPVGWRDGRFTMHLLPLLGSVKALHEQALRQRGVPDGRAGRRP